jgi:hypothetical protein
MTNRAPENVREQGSGWHSIIQFSPSATVGVE